jgi:TM2 domain-containing membrane protein YozV
MQVMQGLLVVLAFLLSFGFKTFLFFTVLWYVLSQESLIERMVRDLLPISPDKKTDAVRTLRQVRRTLSITIL